MFSKKAATILKVVTAFYRSNKRIRFAANLKNYKGENFFSPL